MAEETLHALVLRRQNSGETDRRLTILSPERGKLDVVAKGARKPASRLAGVSDPLTLAVLGIAEGKKNRFITQAQPIKSYRKLRGDFDRLSYGLSLAELASAVLPWEEPAPDAFDLLAHVLADLEDYENPLVPYLWGQVKLLEIAGFQPSFESCVVTDRPMRESMPFLSPAAGGHIAASEAANYPDRYQAKGEVLIGLSRLSELGESPKAMKMADLAAIALFPFWRYAADIALPATDAVVNELYVKRAAE